MGVRILLLILAAGLGDDPEDQHVEDTHHTGETFWESFWAHLHSPEMIDLYGKIGVALIALAGVIITARYTYRKLKH